MEEAMQELKRIVELAVELSSKQIKEAEVRFFGRHALIEVDYRDWATRKLQYQEVLYITREDAWPKLRKVRHDLEAAMKEKPPAKGAPVCEWCGSDKDLKPMLLGPGRETLLCINHAEQVVRDEKQRNAFQGAA